MIGFLIIMVVTVSTLAGLGAYVAQSTNLAHRRNDMIAAIQFAEGGAVIACNDLNSVVTNKANSSLNSKLVNMGYSQIGSLNTSSETVYQRTISAPFGNQTVTARMWLPNTTTSKPESARIVATAAKGKVTRTVTVNLKMKWAYPAAIVSTNPGKKTTSNSKDTDSGNVAVNGAPIVVDGGSGLAILANGYVNVDPGAQVPPGAISSTNYNTADEIPDYTSQGSANTLFDFDRYVAIADCTTNKFNPKGSNHFTNLATFFAANNKVSSPTNANPASRYLEGVIVVDIAGKDPNVGKLDPSSVPYGINVKGTLFFKFDSSFGASSKIINTAAMNVNPANLAGFVATNAATYPSGYPPVYYDNSKNPTNINITSKGFANVAPDEDLPALLYSIGILDIHGPANVSGVMYTPSFVELENKADGQIQYFKGSIICGLGMYYENNKKSTSVVSFDANTIDSLGTVSSAGKQLKVTYWQ